MKQHVHIYAIVRVKVEDIEADTHEQATEKAYKLIQGTLDTVLCDRNMNSLPPQVKDIAYADEVDGFLVVEVGDEECNNDTWHDKHGKKVEAT